jgi:hypothetical protein
MRHWQKEYRLDRRGGLYYQGAALVIADPDDGTIRGVMGLYHDSITAGHPGQAKTFQATARDYWWPGMRKDVATYVQGCAICQANKIITKRNAPGLHPIPPAIDAKPFETIAIDLIVKLPISNGYDSILTITDHDCTKGIILIPCREDMGTEELAKQFKERAFPYIGLPTKIISDRDTRFASKLMREAC